MLAREEILIRTLPLGVGNYGGIAQAYALQRVLESLGMKPRTDVSDARPSPHGAIVGRARTVVRNQLVRTGLPGFVREEWVRYASRPVVDERVHTFVRDHISTAHVYRSGGDIDFSEVDRAGAFVAGSDQIWRATWSQPVTDQLFDFLKAQDSRPRFSYAASFGVDSVRARQEFGDDLIERSRALAQRFQAISVREFSGIDVANDLWGVEAVRHVDPTLLLARERYRHVAEAADPIVSKGDFVDYVLDEAPSTRSVVEQVARAVGVESRAIMPPAPRTWHEFRRERSRFMRPGVEQWLGAFDRAGFGITDSFHGTVFSIINNVPFLALVNRARGAARFEDLLSLFGLEDRLIEPGRTVSNKIIDATIDWKQVNAKIEVERERSLNYLREQLKVDDS